MQSDPEEMRLLAQRRRNHFQRKQFWAAGFMDVITVDQHDKLKKYGLALHVGIEPMSGVCLWLNAWHNNNNPKLILSYYLDYVEAYGCKPALVRASDMFPLTYSRAIDIPLVTQSDPGTENWYIANAQSFLREWHDPAMQGCLAHRWMSHKKNIKPEIFWSQVRRRFSPGAESLIARGVVEEAYNPDNMQEAFVFRCVFMPWISAELEGFRDRVNNARKRRDRNKVLPHGIPNEIAERPSDYGVLDFKVTLVSASFRDYIFDYLNNNQIKVDPQAIAAVRALWAPKEDPIFQLVPPEFAAIFERVYETLGRPVVTRKNAWDVYDKVLYRIRSEEMAAEFPPGYQDNWAYAMGGIIDRNLPRPEPDLGLQEDTYPLGGGRSARREDGSYYFGGVNHGRGPNGMSLSQYKERLRVYLATDTSFNEELKRLWEENEGGLLPIPDDFPDFGSEGLFSDLEEASDEGEE